MGNTTSLTKVVNYIKLTHYINNLTTFNGLEINKEINQLLLNTILENNKLTELYLENYENLTDEHLTNLHKATNLKKLYFVNTGNLTEDSTSQISKLINLEELIIFDKYIPDYIFKQILYLPKLKKLDLTNCNIPNAELEQLKKELPNININSLNMT